MENLRVLLFQIKFINNIDEFLKKVDLNRKEVCRNERFSASPPKRCVKEMFSSLLRRQNYLKSLEYGDDLISSESPKYSITQFYHEGVNPRSAKDFTKNENKNFQSPKYKLSKERFQQENEQYINDKSNFTKFESNPSVHQRLQTAKSGLSINRIQNEAKSYFKIKDDNNLEENSATRCNINEHQYRYKRLREIKTSHSAFRRKRTQPKGGTQSSKDLDKVESLWRDIMTAYQRKEIATR